MAWILAGCVLLSLLDRAGWPIGLMTGVALLRESPSGLVAFAAACAVAGAIGDLGCYAIGARWLRADRSVTTGFRARVWRWVRPVQARTPLWLCASKLTLPVNLAVSAAAGVLGFGAGRTFAWCLLGSVGSMSAWAAITWFGLAPLLALPPTWGAVIGVVLVITFLVAWRAVDRRLAELAAAEQP